MITEDTELLRELVAVQREILQELRSLRHSLEQQAPSNVPCFHSAASVENETFSPQFQDDSDMSFPLLEALKRKNKRQREQFRGTTCR